MSEQNGSKKQRSLSRREFLRNASALAGVGLLAACVPTEAPSAPAAQEEADTSAPAVNTGAKQKVRYLSWWFEEGNRGETWVNFIKEFNESQNEIEVVAENTPFDQYTTKTIVGAQSGELDGDIIMATPELAPRLIQADLLAPLDEVLTRNNITDLSSAHDAMRKDGKLYGLDMVTVAFGILYNKQRYEEANITPATTPDEWIAVSEALTNRDEQQYGFFMSHLVSEPADFWFQLEEWCMPYDGVWAEGKTPLLTSEPIVRGLKLFKEMYDVAMPQGADTPTGNRLFQTGAVAQGLFVSAAVGAFTKDAPELYPLLRSAPIPWESNKSIARIHPMMINKASPVKDEALEFVAYMYEPDNYRRMVEGSQDVIFAQPSAARQEYLDALEWLKPGYDGVEYVTPFDVVGDFVFNFNEFGQIVITNFADVLNAGKSVEEAMEVAQTQAEALAERIE
jgi:ABC-type glycerol-3-phosphate transport system substrate-binding protein